MRAFFTGQSVKSNGLNSKREVITLTFKIDHYTCRPTSTIKKAFILNKSVITEQYEIIRQLLILTRDGNYWWLGDVVVKMHPCNTMCLGLHPSIDSGWLGGVVVRMSDLRLAVVGSNPGHGITGFSEVGDRLLR